MSKLMIDVETAEDIFAAMPGEVVENNYRNLESRFAGKGRWNDIYEVVFENLPNHKSYRFSWDVAACETTEVENPDMVECEEVEAYQATVFKYRVVQ